LTILKKAMDQPGSGSKHMPTFYDSGSTDYLKFMIIQPLGESLQDISREKLKAAFTMSTAIRTAIQTLQAIWELHMIGFLHRSLGPQAFFVGAGTKMRTVYMGDLGIPYSFRNSKNGKIRRPRSRVPVMGLYRYMPRASHNCKEHSRNDDLESWAYMTMEFFDLEALPWRKDRKESDILRKKQKTIDGAYPSAFEVTTLRFKHILRYISSLTYYSRPNYIHIRDVLMGLRKLKNVKFNVPYDWEVFSEVRDKLEADPINNKIPTSPHAKSPAQNSGTYADPTKEISKEESICSPNPASIGSDISNEPSASPKTAIVNTKPNKSKKVVADKSEYFIPMAEKRVLRGMPEEESQSKPKKIDGSPKFELSDENTN